MLYGAYKQWRHQTWRSGGQNDDVIADIATTQRNGLETRQNSSVSSKSAPPNLKLACSPVSCREVCLELVSWNDFCEQ